ncbi:MAG: xanthine phosphoribosyltransferase [Rhodospirillales bacterium]|jgi:xanthine phosphoribosyltransferase|nr:xanthine phosphoribosyltransferase [Rhodospirillales bacterium]
MTSTSSLDYGQASLLHLGWERLHTDSLRLSKLLTGMRRDWQGLVAITRGGLVPAAVVARELCIRKVETLSIVSYDERRQGEAQVLKGAAAAMKDGGRGWLVIDDLTDSGVTARLVRQLLPKAFIAAVYAKPLGAPTLDLFAKEVEQAVWVVFPWDINQ